MAAADYVSVVQQLYVSYFGRPADVDGLANYTAALDTLGVPATLAGIEAAFRAGDATIVSLVNSFDASTEATSLYGSGTVESFVFAVYDNVLNRVPDAEGFAFWVNAINSGALSRSLAALSIMEGALANTTTQGLLDAALVSTRITVATNFTTAITTENATFAGDTAAQAARDMLATVTADTDVTAFQDTIVSTLTTITDPNAGGQTFTLTNSATADTILGTAKNDTINGASGTVVAGDTIIDSSSADNDTANLVLTTAYTPTKITGVENLNLAWDAFGTATYNLAGVTGAKNVTLTSNKVGYLGSATVTNADGITLTAGTGTIGTLTASGFKTGTVDGSKAKVLVVDGSTTNADNASIVVKAGASTTSVTVGGTNGFISTTVDAGTATTVAVTDAGNLTDTTALTVNANATITNGTTGAMTLTASDTNNITMNTIGASLTVNGTGNVILNSTGLTAETVTNSKQSGTLTVKTSSAGALNLAKVQATTIELSGTKAGADTVANGANLKYTGGGAIEVIVTGTGTNDAVTAELTSATATSVTATGVETLTVKSSAPEVSGADLTIGSLATKGNTVKFIGTNDVAVTNIAVTGEANGKIDASGLTGALTVGINTTADTENFSIVGGSGKVTVTTANISGDQSVVGGVADDSVTADATTTGSMTAVLADGKNTVSATGLTTGTLVVQSGSGIDTVTAGAALTTGVINLDLGDGANVINLDDAVGAGTRVVTTGGGDDTLTFTGGLDDANDVLTWTAGAGNNTFVLATEGADISAAKVTLSGVTTIKVAADTGADITVASATIAAGDLTGQAYTIKADSYVATTSIAVKGEATASTIDLSGLTIDQSITAGISRVYVDASANTTTAQTITGTAVADYITGGGKGDTIVAGKGADVITGGAGNDSIDITELVADSAVDTIKFEAIATNGVDTITGFKSGTDKLSLLGGAESTVATGAGAAAVDFFATALTNGAAAYILGAGTGALTTNTADVVVISTTLSSNGNLALSTNGTELLKALSSTSTAATQITANTASDDFYMVAYQGGDAYLYQVTNDANTAVLASEITLIGTVKDVTAGSLAAADFLVQS